MIITQMIQILIDKDELDHLPFKIEHGRIHENMKPFLKIKDPLAQSSAWMVVTRDGSAEIFGEINRPTQAVLTLTDTTLNPFIREAKSEDERSGR